MMYCKRRRLSVVVAIAVGTGIVCCMALLFNVFNSIQLYSGDVLFKTATINKSADGENKVVIVAIDDNSLQELGKISQWPRSYYARLVDTLAAYNARLIVFDVLFAEASPDDDKLAASMKDAGNVILPVAKISAASNSEIVDENQDEGIFLRPVPVLEESAIALGHAEVLPAQDGTVRYLSLAVKDGSGDIPALSLAAVAKYLRRPCSIGHSDGGGVLYFAGRSIPVTNDSDMIINYTSGANKINKTIYQTVSFVDVLKGNVDAGLFNDKIAIIGATADGLGDTFWTPLGAKLNGVEIHANAIHTILSGSFIKQAPAGITMVSILILCLLCGLIVMYFQPLWAIFLTLILYLAYVTGVSISFEQGVMLNPFYPSLGILCSFVGVSLYNAVWERSRRHTVEKTFGRYVSPSISSRILKELDRGDINLDGEEQEITVAFADVRGFTEIAHSIETRELVKSLNAYLAVIIQAVIKHGGIINKFNGDGVMAIWNAPTACEQHYLRAIKAAMEAQNGIKELQQKKPSLLKMDFGIGISTGTAVCGNLGCEDRLEYSAIGTTVNSASRITDAAPGGKVLVSEDTYKLVREYVEAKSLGKVVIKRENESFDLYEIVGIYGSRDGINDCVNALHPGTDGHICKKRNLVFEWLSTTIKG